jgi:lipase maturation factor 1
MAWSPASGIRWLIDSDQGPKNRLVARWIFLRALGGIYFSAFFSLLFQIKGLMGPDGIFPVQQFLAAVANHFNSAERFWYAPSLFWISDGNHMLMTVMWIGLIASVLVVLNLWPRAMLIVCFICFVSFVTTARIFSGYQSDSMLLEAGFLAIFFAPGGLRPGLAASRAPSRISLFLLLWEWFRIYFESGVAKIVSHDEQWRHLTAIYDYFQNGPLPTWVGWYAANLPHWFLKGAAGITLGLELGLVWMMFLPRRFRIILFFIVTPWELGIIFTANYTFLNYLVLCLGFLLLDDQFLARFVPQSWRNILPVTTEPAPLPPSKKETYRAQLAEQLKPLRLSIFCVLMLWLFYSSTARMIWMLFPNAPLPMSPVVALERWRVADQYGLFAVMTPERYEIEFQGSNDGTNWTPYPFRFKPQDVNKAPGIYAPYQPRFDWNLWFASLEPWRSSNFVPETEVLLLKNNPDVLSLFAGNPFPNAPPKIVRAVNYQYWFTTPAEKRETGAWWRRQFLGLYAPEIELEPDGRIGVLEWPANFPAGPSQP